MIESLKDVIQFAYEKAEGFKQNMERAGLSPNDITSIEDLEKIPILKKRPASRITEGTCTLWKYDRHRFEGNGTNFYVSWSNL
ncbi:hypothetical protein [Peribacillus tepidiphilus]|uniref:hypothetical protein n=1 Tax=Peribacillus tepidiphilus TaxID=2652445 RepID=UPI0035B534E2